MQGHTHQPTLWLVPLVQQVTTAPLVHQVAPSVLRGISAQPPPKRLVAPPNTAVQEPLHAVIVLQAINVTAPPLPLLQSVLLERTLERRPLLVPAVRRDTSVPWTE